jgi:hypothetical protein
MWGKVLSQGHYQKQVHAQLLPHAAPSSCNALDLRPYPTRKDLLIYLLLVFQQTC